MILQSSRPFSHKNTFQIDNPYTGEIIHEVPFLTKDEQKAIIERSVQAFRTNRYTPLDVRKKEMTKLIRYLEDVIQNYEKFQKKEEIAIDITSMMGKPLM